jgi:hypothetical protein
MMWVAQYGEFCKRWSGLVAGVGHENDFLDVLRTAV